MTRTTAIVISAVLFAVSLPVIGVVSLQTYRWTLCREAGALAAKQAEGSGGLGITPVVEYDVFNGCSTTILGTKVQIFR
ncbi:hypothetical protein [Pseudosporangium ferrugineum]|uniref:Uncharacterized protein n=1 Tax=Pseudosporangium ferrugineum TaxID=439699 RepID=A0A2T0RS84_9ACTN|nr:hypothetical protein [Pseudosporangium ferrugineum]PRY24044.1 hypothetical protein CLV70_114177 [Pseudosporangium ferrugineum]